MKIGLIELSNKFKIIHIEKASSGIVSMSLLGKAGSSFEEIPGTAHFLEHVAMNGSKKYPSKKKLVSNIQKNGGYTNGTTGKEFVEYVVKIVHFEVESGFDFLSQVVFYPLIKSEKVEKERKIILQEHSRAFSNNQRQLIESMIGSTYKSKAMNYMVLGNEDGISKITKNDLDSFWKKYYSINNFVLCVCGDIDEDKTRQLAEKYFGKLIPSAENIEFVKHEASKSSSIKILRRKDIDQARISLSFLSPPFPTRKYYVAQLISHILGKGALSRLNQSIREINQLAYDIYSRIWSGYEYGIFYIEAGISDNKINDVINLISKELKTISKKALSLNELSTFKKQLQSFLLFGFENSLQVATYHVRHFYISSDLISYKKELEIINDVSPEEIMQVATEMFSKNPNLSVLTKNIKEQDLDLKRFL